MADDTDYAVKNRIRNIKDNGYQIKFVDSKKYLTKSSIQVPIYTHPDAKKRILALFDWTSTAESNTGQFFSPGYSGGIFTNVLSYLENQGQVANFLCIPVNKDTDLLKIIEKVKPDHVMVSGFDLLTRFLPGRYAEIMTRLPGAFRGRIFKYKDFTVSSTFSGKYLLDLNPKTYETTVNLLDYFMRDVENAIHGENRYTLPSASEMEAKTITTMKEWKTLLKLIKSKKVVSVDTETENLNRKFNNRILTIHFAFDAKVGWCLPFYHRQTPFKGSELEEIKQDLAEWLQFGESKFLIFQNAKFDLAMFMRDLKINYIKHDLFDVSAAEFILGENRKFIADAKATLNGKEIYTLEHLCLYYGSLAYLEGDIAKGDRARMAELELSDIAVYGAKDVCLPYQMAKFQIAEAERRGSNYDKFRLAVTKLCSDTFHVMANMEFNGSLVDIDYIRAMLMPNSKFIQRINELRMSFKDFKSAKRANKALIEKGSKNYKQGLFGEIEDSWMFNIDKQDHLQILFFDILQLQVLSYRKDKGAKLDKQFIAEYEGTVPEVAKLSEYRKLKTLKNTFIVGILKVLTESPDCIDSRIRANYNFLYILTLRSSAQKPNLQAIPSRGKNAKLIKREFIAPKWKIILKGDFNAHEVRGWGNVANDIGIAEAFQPGLEIRRQLRLMFNKDTELHAAVTEKMDQVGWKDIKDPKEKLKIAKKSNFVEELTLLTRLESEGDVHKKNYEYFFGKPAMEVTEDERQSVKQVVFGVLYGKGAPNLARELFKKELRALQKKHGMDSEAYVEAANGYIKECQIIINTMFKRFVTGKAWIDGCHMTGKEGLENVSVFGAVRHLSGYLHTERQILGKMDRRGPNSMIQGPSSNIGYTGARQLQHTNFALEQLDIDMGWLHNNMVHDSTENESFIDMLPLTAYYLEHSMTTAVYKRCRDTFGWDMPIQMEFDLELGGSMATTHKFDYTRNNLISSVEKSIEWMNEELHYNLPTKKLLKAVGHNWDLIWPFREKELKQMKGYKSSDCMILTPKVAATLDWKRVARD